MWPIKPKRNRLLTKDYIPMPLLDLEKMVQDNIERLKKDKIQKDKDYEEAQAKIKALEDKRKKEIYEKEMLKNKEHLIVESSVDGEDLIDTRQTKKRKKLHKIIELDTNIGYDHCDEMFDYVEGVKWDQIKEENAEMDLVYSKRKDVVDELNDILREEFLAKIAFNKKKEHLLRGLNKIDKTFNL